MGLRFLLRELWGFARVIETYCSITKKRTTVTHAHARAHTVGSAQQWQYNRQMMQHAARASRGRCCVTYHNTLLTTHMTQSVAARAAAVRQQQQMPLEGTQHCERKRPQRGHGKATSPQIAPAHGHCCCCYCCCCCWFTCCCSCSWSCCAAAAAAAA